MTSSKDKQSGESMLSILVAVAILGIFAAVIATQLVNGNKASKHTDLATNLTAVKSAVLTLMDCQATVGAQNQCLPSDVFPLRQSDGTLIFPGGIAATWQVSGYCKNNILMIQATGTRKDPTLNTILSFKDVFAGTTAFCANLFNPPPTDPCQASPDAKNGVTYDQSNGTGQPCCRTVIGKQLTPGAVQDTMCLPTVEYARNGAGRCWMLGQTDPHNFCAGPQGCSQIQESIPVTVGNTQGWEVGCASTANLLNTFAQAMVTCCPYY